MKVIAKTIFVFIFFLTVFLCNSFAQEFSADVNSSTMGQRVSGRIYNAPGKARLEANGVTTIARIDKGVAWVLMPEQKAYMEMPLSSSSVVAGSDKMPGEIERKLIGQETLDGKLADKYYIVYTTAGKTQAIYSWILPDSGIPMKTVAEDGSWQIEYKNITVGPQADNLFDVPSDYSKFAMPSIKDMMENTLKNTLGN